MKKISVKLARIILIGIGILIALAISSCDSQKRCNRFLRNHPKCVTLDTIVYRDTFVKEIRIPVPEYRDSFIIKNDTMIETKKIVIVKFKDKFTVRIKPDTFIYRDTTRIEVKTSGRVVEKKTWNWLVLIIAFTTGVITTIFISRK